MAGIINYYHGESGIVADCWWGLAGDILAYYIEFQGDPHRSWAWDYGSDIGIDPEITRGDEVVYLRLEDTTGMWVRSSSRSAGGLREAVARVLDNRRKIEAWRQAKSADQYTAVAQEIYEAGAEPVRVMTTEASEAALAIVSAGWGLCSFGAAPLERPNAAASFFLSHAAEDTLLARHVFEDLRSEANADVWLDLSQPKQGVLQSDATIAKWLQNAIHAMGGFVVLWTEHAAASDWVKSELRWAREQRAIRSNFDVILLKLRDVDVTAEFAMDSLLVDCNEIWWSNGLNEELYARIFGRQSRREWLATLPADAPASKGTTIGYRDFVSDSGTVVRFEWAADAFLDTDPPRKDIQWQLDYARRDGELRHVAGGGKDKPADLGMKPGDRVGFFKVRWRHGSHVLAGPELWMRSGDLAVTSDTVLDEYFRELHGSDP